MGLDMYVVSVPADAYEAEVDFRVETEVERNELHYWRKHNALHGWMEQLYRSKGGQEESFNCVSVNLNMIDILDLEKAVISRALPKTEGFFFGFDSSFDDERREDDLKFIEAAKHELQDGRKIYYTSWW